MIDRLGPRRRPPGTPVMHQTWGKLLFLHWSFAPEAVRPLVPEGLELDLFEGRAWVGVTPFTMWGMRPPLLPAVPVLSRTHEMNVRTYVHRDGFPGVWFFSLEAANPLAVWGARLAFRLPYHQAQMSLEEEEDGTIEFRSERKHPGAPSASLRTRWSGFGPVREATPGTLDFFLVERYALFAEHGDSLRRARIHHRPWPLREARVQALETTMLEAHGLLTPAEPPLVHAQAEPLEVEVWAPEET
jgi:uncharacterized protein